MTSNTKYHVCFCSDHVCEVCDLDWHDLVIVDSHFRHTMVTQNYN